MSDYERGIEAAEDYVQTAHTGTTAEGIIEAFLAVQPEAWWCNEHDSKAPPPGPSGNPGLEKCERLRLDAYIDPSTTQYICRMVQARIVVTP